MPPNTVSVARPVLWGNPFFVSRWRDAAICVALFRDRVQGIWNPATSAHLPLAWNGYPEHTDWHARWRKCAKCSPMEMLSELRGHNHACWCQAGALCHVEVLLELAASHGRR